MTEDELIDEICRLGTADRFENAFTLSEKGIIQFPVSAELQCLFGDLGQISDTDRFSLKDALSAYEKAVLLDPDWAEPWESIGHVCDILGDLAHAEAAFRKAIELGAEADSYAGLARVLAQRGNPTSEILSLIDSCPFAESPAIKETRLEIENGMWKPD
ncbi:MAG: hypothetical protein ACKV0T_16525 [Planctomycetales bacterium]